MELKDAIKVLDDVIPPPRHPTVDLEHSQIAYAWQRVKEELKELKATARGEIKA